MDPLSVMLAAAINESGGISDGSGPGRCPEELILDDGRLHRSLKYNNMRGCETTIKTLIYMGGFTNTGRLLAFLFLLLTIVDQVTCISDASPVEDK